MKNPLRKANVVPIALLGCLAGVAIAEPDSGAQAAAPALDTVTVQARTERETLERRIGGFVAAITTHSDGEALARWQVPMCPLVVGLPPEQAEFVQLRLGNVARESGATVTPSPCKGNFVVVMTAQPEKFLQEWFERYPRLFNDDRGVGGIKRFIANGPAVRVWYNACSQAPGGKRQLASAGNLNCNSGTLGSRLSYESIRAIYSVIVVVDLGRIDGFKFGQLSDYIAMVGLAQIRDSASAGDAPSILRLLTAPVEAKPSALSSWDQAFLKSLYATNSATLTQVSEIKRSMARDLGP